MVQVCVNGGRGSGDGALVPLSPKAMAGSAAEAVAAGASDIHVHPKSPCGEDTLSAKAVAATLDEIRSQVDVPVGVTTGAWAEPDPAARVARVREWSVLPDHASVNWHEPGAEEVAAALLERGMGVEAGIWSGTDGAARFAASPLGPRVLRVLAEVTDPDPETAEDTARELLAALGTTHGRPALLHGEEGGTWPVLDLAARLGLATRIGLEDTLTLPDGRRATSNAQLVTEALARYGSGYRSGSGSGSAYRFGSGSGAGPSSRRP
ncbi:3-keto-5-aminohexanoate cleavage protein [Streptomyces tauricus]|uniref:3-keto-5-aminohexanoate cleavage protein n=1 Tax=Streptomyces tauricus TaxID=68274 RepID=A0ABZ1JSP6_9ACTN|nr:3-keto-5-aminohexanoate cleavage protein [Streptomyces tauricus]